MKQPSYRCTEKLWKPIVRPPRHNYRMKDMGNEIFMVSDTVTKRFDFEIQNSRRLILQCSLFEPIRMQEKPHPCMIYLHGNSSSRVEALTIIEYLIPSNISVCGIDLSGSGQSQGEYISLGYYESRDVNDLYEYLRDKKPFITQIGLWGRSMGSVTAILAATLNKNLKVLVCDSPFSNLTHLCQELASNSYNIPSCCFSCFWCLVKAKIRREVKFNIDDLNISQLIQTLPTDVSIVFLSAKQDQLIVEKHPKILMEKFRGTKLLKQFEGTHNSKRPQDVMIETVQFVIMQFDTVRILLFLYLQDTQDDQEKFKKVQQSIINIVGIKTQTQEILKYPITKKIKFQFLILMPLYCNQNNLTYPNWRCECYFNHK